MKINREKFMAAATLLMVSNAGCGKLSDSLSGSSSRKQPEIVSDTNSGAGGGGTQVTQTGQTGQAGAIAAAAGGGGAVAAGGGAGAAPVIGANGQPIVLTPIAAPGPGPTAQPAGTTGQTSQLALAPKQGAPTAGGPAREQGLGGSGPSREQGLGGGPNREAGGYNPGPSREYGRGPSNEKGGGRPPWPGPAREFGRPF